MYFVKRLMVGLVALVSTAALAACGGGGSGNNEVSVPSGQYAFSPTSLNVGANQAAAIHFNNTGGQAHNFVLVSGGDDVAAAVDEDATNSGDPNYLPSDMSPVVAHSSLLNTGSAEDVAVNLPAGTYTYLCTVPGHYASGMKGTITVQ